MPVTKNNHESYFTENPIEKFSNQEVPHSGASSKDDDFHSGASSYKSTSSLEDGDEENNSNSVFLPLTHNDVSGGIFPSETSPQEPLEASKVSSIFVNCKLKDGRIFLKVNSTQRPDVKELPPGESQGDHVTPFGSFIKAIVNSADQSKIEDTPKILRKISKAILSNSATEIDDIPATNDGISIIKTHDREKRKKLTATLSYAKDKDSEIMRDLESLPQDSPLRSVILGIREIFDHKEEFKSDLKDGALSKYCREIEDLTNFFLVKIQSEKNISFPSKGKLDKDNKEGSRIKNSVNALTALNSLYGLMSKLDSSDLTDDEKKELIEKLDDKIINCKEVRLGFNVLNKIKVVEAKDAEKLTKQVADGLKKTKNMGEIKTYLEKVDNDLVPDKIMISHLFCDLFDFKREVDFSGGKKETRNVEDLYDVSARHLVIMFTAFKGIADYFKTPTKDLIIDGFLISVIDKQGWKSCGDLGDTNSKKLENLKKNVGLRIEIKDGYYQLKPREEEKSKINEPKATPPESTLLINANPMIEKSDEALR